MTGSIGAIVWLIIAVVLLVIEGATVQLFCIWFAVGSLFAMIFSFFGAPFWLQLLVFLATSIGALIAGRPILLQRVTPRREATNADRVIGQIGIVLEEIDNIRQTGRVSANGLEWTARSEFGDVIPAGIEVYVTHMDGVKLIVHPLHQPVAPSEETAGSGDFQSIE